VKDLAAETDSEQARLSVPRFCRHFAKDVERRVVESLDQRRFSEALSSRLANCKPLLVRVFDFHERLRSFLLLALIRRVVLLVHSERVS
jgi:hypothetical protein